MFWYAQERGDTATGKKMPTQKEDLGIYPPLQPYVESPDAVGVMEWNEKQADIEEGFEQMESVHVDVSTGEPALVFYYPESEAEEMPTDDTEG